MYTVHDICLKAHKLRLNLFDKKEDIVPKAIVRPLTYKPNERIAMSVVM